MAVNGSHSEDAPSAPAERLLAGAADAARRAHERLAHVVTDLFLPDDPRLSDLQRATMTQLLAKLVAAVEDDLRQRLLAELAAEAPAELQASLAAGRLAIAAPILDESGLLRDPDLVAVLLRRSEEHRLVIALHLNGLAENEAEHAPDLGLFDQLLQAGDAELAAAVMGLLIGESRRFDRFQDPLLARTDLPAELQHRLVWWVAAALQAYVTDRHDLDPAVTDRALVAAAGAALAAYDEGETLEGRAMSVARRLQALDLLRDRLIVRAIREGKVALAVATLALRAGIDFAAAWDMFADVEGDRLTLLLRAIGMDRDSATEILLRLASVDPKRMATSGIDFHVAAFEQLQPLRAEAALRPWRLDRSYMRAVADLTAARAGIR